LGHKTFEKVNVINNNNYPFQSINLSKWKSFFNILNNNKANYSSLLVSKLTPHYLYQTDNYIFKLNKVDALSISKAINIKEKSWDFLKIKEHLRKNNWVVIDDEDGTTSYVCPFNFERLITDNQTTTTTSNE